MYEYIKGKYIGINKDYIVVENNGIGYKIFTSGATMAELPKSGEEVMLYVEQIVREDFIGLYGFIGKEELQMFKLLLSINGVGAKAALSLLSIRIILELQDKLKKEDMVIDKEQMDMDNDFNEDNNYASTLSEVMGALLALGYSEKEAELALKKVNKNDTVENVIKECLKVLMG